jgi:hypothetical protein
MTPRFGEDAIWWSFPLGTGVTALLTSLYYLRGGWRKSRMLKDDPRERALDATVGIPPVAHAPEEGATG